MDFLIAQVNEPWCMEQECDIEAGKRNGDEEKEREREQGLDQVPTRLASDSDRDQENGEKHRSHHLAMPPNGMLFAPVTLCAYQ